MDLGSPAMRVPSGGSQLLLCLILQAGLLFGSYILIVYGANYSQRVPGLPANWNFIAGLVAAVANIVALMIMARLSDRIGRKPLTCSV
jgi:hypothetical protein